MSWDRTEHGQSPFGQAEVWKAGEGWGAARKEPSLLGAEDVLATARAELLADADRALAGAVSQLPPDGNLPRVKCSAKGPGPSWLQGLQCKFYPGLFPRPVGPEGRSSFGSYKVAVPSLS